MRKEAKRAAWVEINLANMEHNIQSIRGKIGAGIDIYGIIKADAYGHGSREAARILRQNGVKTFGVATIAEAVELRESGAREEILLLGLTPQPYADAIVAYDLTPVTCDYQNARAIAAEAKKKGKRIGGFVAVDTGMGRIGYRADDPRAADEIKKIFELPNFSIKGLFSHFAAADAADKSYAHEQERLFSAFCDKLKAAGLPIGIRTLANSAAIMELPSSHYEAVRPGIILYGCYPSAETDKAQIALKPVMSVKANIVQLKKVPPGASVSYGRRFIAERESLIATLPLGYADGLPRPYSAQAHVIVGGRLAPIAGTICMDQCMADVTDVPGVQAGDEVIVMGSDGKNAIWADHIAHATGTINYEILCAFGQRLPKVYV